MLRKTRAKLLAFGTALLVVAMAAGFDGVGARLDLGQLRAWTIGGGAARERLPASVVSRKAPAVDDPDLEALIDYLQGLK